MSVADVKVRGPIAPENHPVVGEFLVYCKRQGYNPLTPVYYTTTPNGFRYPVSLEIQQAETGETFYLVNFRAYVQTPNDARRVKYYYGKWRLAD